MSRQLDGNLPPCNKAAERKNRILSLLFFFMAFISVQVYAQEIKVSGNVIRELVGEELRRFTLVRTGKLLERTKKYNSVSGPKMDEHHALCPIPQSVIDSNTGAEYPQNPGYSK